MHNRFALVVLACGLISTLVAVLLDGAILTVAAIVLTFYSEHRPIFQLVLFLLLTLSLVLFAGVFCQWKHINLFREEKKP